MTTKKETRKLRVADVAAGALAAAAAAGATYYFYAGKGAKQHRRTAVRWMNGMKKEVVRQAKKIEELDEAAMYKVVDRVARTYKGMKSVDPAALSEAAKELKDNWDRLAKEMRPVKKSAKKVAKKKVSVARKVVKKRR